MYKKWLYFSLTFVLIFVIDQSIKYIFLNGFRYEGSPISLIFVLNKGVAFSMFSFLGVYLKYIQIGILIGIFVYLFINKEFFTKFYIEFAALIAAGFSNIFDRFIHGGVVDYVYWHKWFSFAVFNFADVVIDISIVIILLRSYFHDKSKQKLKKDMNVVRF